MFTRFAMTEPHRFAERAAVGFGSRPEPYRPPCPRFCRVPMTILPAGEHRFGTGDLRHPAGACRSNAATPLPSHPVFAAPGAGAGAHGACEDPREVALV